MRTLTDLILIPTVLLSILYKTSANADTIVSTFFGDTYTSIWPIYATAKRRRSATLEQFSLDHAFDNWPSGVVSYPGNNERVFNGTVELVFSTANYGTMGDLGSDDIDFYSNQLRYELTDLLTKSADPDLVQFVDGTNHSLAFGWHEFNTSSQPFNDLKNTLIRNEEVKALFSIPVSKDKHRISVTSGSLQLGSNDSPRVITTAVSIGDPSSTNLILHSLGHVFGLGHTSTLTQDENGNYIAIEKGSGLLTAMSEFSLASFNGEIYSPAQLHFLRWRAPEEFEFVDLGGGGGGTQRLRNAGPRLGLSSSIGLLGLVFEDPFGGLHYLSYHQVAALANDSQESDYGLLHEMVVPGAAHGFTTIQGPRFLARGSEDQLGDTGLVIKVVTRTPTYIDVSFSFDAASFNMPIPYVQVVRKSFDNITSIPGDEYDSVYGNETTLVKVDHSYTLLQFVTTPRYGSSLVWQSQPYRMNFNQAKLFCSTGATYLPYYTEQQRRAWFVDGQVDAGGLEVPQLCYKNKCRTTGLNRILQFRIPYVLRRRSMQCLLRLGSGSKSMFLKVIVPIAT